MLREVLGLHGHPALLDILVSMLVLCGMYHILVISQANNYLSYPNKRG